MSDQLGRLLAQGERAAFHGAPRAAIEPLNRAIAVATEAQRRDETAAATWLLGVAQGAAGDCGEAMATLRTLIDCKPDAPAEQRLFAGLAEATLASLLRQLGRHGDAGEHDAAALRLAGSDPLPLVAFDAELGLAADAIGAGDADAASSRLATAQQILDRHPEWWRQRVRLGWVSAELASLQGRPADGTAALGEALALAEEAGAPRHVAKSLLLLAVAAVQTGDAAGAEHLQRAAALAESLDAVPLIWPSRALLGALLAETDPAAAAASLDAARAAVQRIADSLDAPMRADWLARGDIAALAAG